MFDKPFFTLSLLTLLNFLVIDTGKSEELSYSRDVRPILSLNCFRCHGPDKVDRKAKTRLDVPGQADLKKVIERITSDDPDEIMPPPSSNKNLTPEQIQILKRWVAEGAKYEKHWAFVKPKRYKLPDTAHPIDYFIDRKLKEKKLKPAELADPATLLRRVYLDLIGLPPSLEETEAFLKNPSYTHYVKIVNRLLSSPQYGERWARRWLDLARYADTNGYEKDRDRSIWPYRDWVIKSINDDMPFDQFTIEQLAGDMLPSPTPDQLIATGFHRNTMLNEEGGIDPLEFRYHAMTDRMTTTGTTWLGLTLGCAQCHTHKYDPITHPEYFSMMAYLNNADEPEYLISSKENEAQFKNNLKEAERLLKALPSKWPSSQSFEFQTVVPKEVKVKNKTEVKINSKGEVLLHGENPATNVYTVELSTELEKIIALRLETLTHQGKGPGRTAHGNFVLSEIEITVSPLKYPGQKRIVRFLDAKADIEQPTFEVSHAIDGKLSGGWGIHNPDYPLNKDRSASFFFTDPVAYKGGAHLTVKLTQNLGSQHTIGKFRISLGQAKLKSDAESPRAEMEKAFKAWREREREAATSWETLLPNKLSANVPYLVHEGDGIIFQGGDTSKHDVYNLELAPAKSEIRALRLEALPDARLPDGGPGSTFYEGRKGDFYLTEFIVEGRKVKNATETYAKNRFGNNPVSAKLATDGDIQTGWSVSGKIGERHVAVFELEKPIPAGTPVKLEMHFGRHYASSLGKFRLSATSMPNSFATMRSNLLDRLLLKKFESLGAKEQDELLQAFLLQAPELKSFTQRIRQLKKRPRGTRTLIMKERPSPFPRSTFRHHRGEYTQPKEQVYAKLPQALTVNLKAVPKNRLEFAKWLVSKDNPLTGRVIANRHWAAFFGTGLVTTVDDFGMQGSPPSHPDLLDYLANYMMDQNWSIKKLHRHIVMSRTYRRSSSFEEKPSETRWLARFPRQRLEAEIIRDSALKSAGLLNSKMFGPPIRPPQPGGVTEAAYGRPRWNPNPAPERFRRSVYIYLKRTAPFAMILTFDGGSGEFCLAKRDRSNTPLQALTLLNDPMFVEIFNEFGKRLEQAKGSTESKITQAFKRVLTRNPSPEELQRLSAFYQKHRNWSALTRALISLDEAVNKN